MSSETYNLNTGSVDPITITSKDSTNRTRPTTTKTTINSDTKTIPIQHTGLSIAGLILAIISVFDGTILPRLKK